MNETMTPSEAARVLTDAAGFEEALQQRTEGITNMIWALAGPAIFLTYAFAEGYPGFPSWAYAVLWIPWVFAAGTLTGVTWRAAGYAMPNVKDPIGLWGYAWRFLLIVTLLSAIFALWDPQHHAAPLLVIGTMYVGFGALNPYHASQRGRMVSGAIGVALLAGAVALLTQPENGVTLLATILVAGLVPFVGGYWQTMTS